MTPSREVADGLFRVMVIGEGSNGPTAWLDRTLVGVTPLFSEAATFEDYEDARAFTIGRHRYVWSHPRHVREGSPK